MSIADVEGVSGGIRRIVGERSRLRGGEVGED